MNLALIVTTTKKDVSQCLEIINKQSNNIFVVLSNQRDKESVIKNKNYIIVNSIARGVSLARNSMLNYLPEDTDYVMFLDDDVILVDNAKEIIEDEINKYKDVNAIYFNCVSLNKDRPIRSIKKDGKIKWKAVSSYGVWGLVIKVDAIKKYNLSFKEEFGPGSKFPVGEDSIYLKELIDKVPNVYMSRKTLIQIEQKESTWFKGYDEQYFINIGAAKSVLYPKTFWLETIKTYIFAKRVSKYSYKQINFFMYQGKQNYRKEY